MVNLLQQGADLTALNTLRLPCYADWYAAPRTLHGLRAVLHEASRHQWPITLMGGGSNVLLPPHLKGVAVCPLLQQWWLECFENSVTAYVGAGVNWHFLVMRLAEQGLWGLENLALIPGNCGATPIQNIGAYGVELKDVLLAVQVLDIASGKLHWMDASACHFGYRDSIFKHQLAENVVVTQVALRLSRQPIPKLCYGDLASRVSASPTPLEVAQAVCAIRQEKLPDPKRLANAGSFFKNPLVSNAQATCLLQAYPNIPHFLQPEGHVKLAAGWLIDQCGLKGWRKGAFGVHERQALVIVHFGGGDRSELLQFADHITQKVFERFNIVLEPEPQVIQG